jgi:hypothetical protein
LKSAGTTAAGVGLANFFSGGSDVEAVTQRVNKYSRPSDLKITDLRIVTVAKSTESSTLILIDTNQSISDLCKMRNDANKTLR